jgi:hypothetical protein
VLFWPSGPARLFLVSYSATTGKIEFETYAILSPVSVRPSEILVPVDLELSGVMDSLALVEKSLRPRSDILIVDWGGLGLLSVRFVMRVEELVG